MVDDVVRVVGEAVDGQGPVRIGVASFDAPGLVEVGSVQPLEEADGPLDVVVQGVEADGAVPAAAARALSVLRPEGVWVIALGPTPPPAARRLLDQLLVLADVVPEVVAGLRVEAGVAVVRRGPDDAGSASALGLVDVVCERALGAVGW